MTGKLEGWCTYYCESVTKLHVNTANGSTINVLNVREDAIAQEVNILTKSWVVHLHPGTGQPQGFLYTYDEFLE